MSATQLHDQSTYSLNLQIRGDLPTPLKWNDERQWTYAVSLQQPVFYLLRDHINLFIDLAKDWSSGPPHDYFRFIPMVYAVEIDLHPFEFNLYANDHNIVDKPLIKDENGALLRSYLAACTEFYLSALLSARA
jgi:hypothetical protein